MVHFIADALMQGNISGSNEITTPSRDSTQQLAIALCTQMRDGDKVSASKS